MIHSNQQGQAARTLSGRNEACPCGSRKKFKHCCLNASASIATQQSSLLAATLDEARRRFAAGQLHQAASLLHGVLTSGPENAEALHFLGLIAHRQGDNIGALSLLNRSLLASPRNASYFINVGLVLKAAGDLPRSLEFFRRATHLEPTMASAHFNLGTTLAQAGGYAEAATTLTEAIRLQPTAEAINTLGVTMMYLGSHERALTCYKQAIALSPDLAAAHSNTGRSLLALGRNAEAAESLHRAVVLDPNFTDAYVNLGATLNEMGRFEEALAASAQALKLQPTNLEAQLNFGNACKGQGKLTPAAEAYRKAVAHHPDEPRAYCNLAETLRDLGKPSEAAAMYRESLRVQPGFITAYSNLLYLHAFTRDVTPEAELEEARGWERAMLSAEEREQARKASLPQAGTFHVLPLAGRKLRIGIVSAELGTHAVAEFLQPLMENLDHELFHLTLFPTVGRWDARAEHMRSLADNCISLAGVSDKVAMERIRSEHIDVLMDTSGHTASNRLGIFARRAAPVQCTYIGYWSTTGLTEMDWFLSDPDAPAAAEAGFSEGLWRLPRIAVCYHGDRSLAHDEWQPDPSGTVWVGSFNKYAKVREETLELWAKVLLAIPEAKLLLEDRGTHEEESQQRIGNGLAQHGVDASRVEFIPYIPGHERHMLLYNRLDIALDTIPFNSGTTAFDALWMGVPLVALDGDWIGGRMGASVLRTLGRREWIAETHDQYVGIVRSLAYDIELRKRLRRTQREEMAASELFDAVDLTHALQNSFVGMYENWLARA